MAAEGARSRAVVAIMAKAPRPGRVKTRLTPPLTPAGAGRLARAFLVDTVRLVAGVPGARGAVLYAPARARAVFARLAPGFVLVRQPSGDLGHRLRAGVRRLLRLGLGPVIVIGADIPALSRATLTQAVRALDGGRADVVLGPSADGGYYLIGVRRPCDALFARIPWSTAGVFDRTRARARARGLRVLVLRRAWDVDTPADLHRLRRWLEHRGGGGPAATRRVLAALHPPRQRTPWHLRGSG
jgi:rSAM/selenodomain-associated transferase 1